MDERTYQFLCEKAREFEEEADRVLGIVGLSVEDAVLQVINRPMTMEEVHGRCHRFQRSDIAAAIVNHLYHKRLNLSADRLLTRK